MKLLTLSLSIFALLFFNACSSYPDDAKGVALAMCQATKTLDLSAMKKYSSKAYGARLKRQMKNFKAALKANDPKALELQSSYAQISCDDITLTEEMGRVMHVHSASPILSTMQIQRINRVWKVIQ